MASAAKAQKDLAEYAQGTLPAESIIDNFVSPIADSFQKDKMHASDLPFNDLWTSFILTARDINADGPGQDRLAALLDQIKGKGLLFNSNEEICETSMGKAWTDLPGLGAQMRHIWNDAPPAMSTEQWKSLNAFAARLTSLEVHDFSLFAIWSLRDALEQERPPSIRQTADGEKPLKSHEEATIEVLLPGAVQWIEHAGPLLVGLTLKSHMYKTAESQPDPAWLGKLCKDAGVVRGGYGVPRWCFWRQRLEELSRLHDDAGGRDKIAKLAYQGLEKMKSLDDQVMSATDG